MTIGVRGTQPFSLPALTGVSRSPSHSQIAALDSQVFRRVPDYTTILPDEVRRVKYLYEHIHYLRDTCQRL